MLFKTLVVVAAAPLLALGRITNFTAPTEAQAGSNITAAYRVQSYISNWQDFGIIWTLKSSAGNSSLANCTSCLGTQIGYENLYLSPKNDLGNQTVQVHIPQSFEAGDYVLAASIPYLVGASGTVDFTHLNHTLTIVDN